MKRFISHSAEETEAYAENLAKKISNNTFVALFGGLGAGKTAFVRGFCKGMDYSGEVTSPTFSLVHEYHGGKIDIFHFDMYRVTDFDSLYSTGFFDYSDKGIIITEWSENIEEFLPEKYIKITITYGKNDNERIIDFEGDEFENTCR